MSLSQVPVHQASTRAHSIYQFVSSLSPLFKFAFSFFSPLLLSSPPFFMGNVRKVKCEKSEKRVDVKTGERYYEEECVKNRTSIYNNINGGKQRGGGGRNWPEPDSLLLLFPSASFPFFLHLFTCPDLLLLIHRGGLLVVGMRVLKHHILRMKQEVTG